MQRLERSLRQSTRPSTLCCPSPYFKSNFCAGGAAHPSTSPAFQMAQTNTTTVAEVASEFERSNPCHWQLFAQGAVNVMFRYQSAEQSHLSRYLLRVAKLHSKHGSGSVEDSPSDEQQRLFRARFFQLCGAQYMPSHIEICVSPTFLSGLPDVGCVLNPCGFACLVQDVSAASDGLTIEIKPKCGIVPFLSNLSKDHACKASTCRFCMYQYTKYKMGKISRISSYCPLQFFRGNHDSTIQNLLALFDCPQNNIKISSANGELLGCDSSDQFGLAKASAALGLSSLGLAHFIAKSLLLSNVLQDIKRVQELDCLGIELLWTRFCESPDSPDILQLVDDFLMSTCAKDVSVIIAIEPLGSCSSEFRPLPDSSCGFRVQIIDVDQRPRAWLQKYAQQDADIVSEFLSSACTRSCILP